jgi:hypothetical protein
VIVGFYKMEVIRFNKTCQLSSLFAMKEINRILPFIAFFSSRFRVFLFDQFSDREVGTCQTCYSCYCPGLLTVFQLSVLTRTHSTEFLSNNHNNTGHQRKKT